MLNLVSEFREKKNNVTATGHHNEAGNRLGLVGEGRLPKIMRVRGSELGRSVVRLAFLPPGRAE